MCVVAFNTHANVFTTSSKLGFCLLCERDIINNFRHLPKFRKGHISLSKYRECITPLKLNCNEILAWQASRCNNFSFRKVSRRDARGMANNVTTRHVWEAHQHGKLLIIFTPLSRTTFTLTILYKKIIMCIFPVNKNFSICAIKCNFFSTRIQRWISVK